MLCCSDCGARFEEPKAVKEPHYELTPTAYETFYVCPKCGNSRYYEAVICDYCQEDINADLHSLYVKFSSGDVICNECLHDYCVNNFTQEAQYVRKI